MARNQRIAWGPRPGWPTSQASNLRLVWRPCDESPRQVHARSDTKKFKHSYNKAITQKTKLNNCLLCVLSSMYLGSFQISDYLHILLRAVITRQRGWQLHEDLVLAGHPPTSSLSGALAMNRPGLEWLMMRRYIQALTTKQSLKKQKLNNSLRFE